MDLRQGLAELEQKHLNDVTELRDKLDDYENRQRRKNLRIVGFRLGVEGNDAVAFLEQHLADILGLDGPIEIERAHRMLQRHPAEQGIPRAFVLKLLRFKDVTQIMEAARKKKDLVYGNSRIMIFPDLSPALHKRRMAFATLKKQLQQAGVRYGMMYPATFRVDTRAGGTESFNSAEAASSFLWRVPGHILPRSITNGI